MASIVRLGGEAEVDPGESASGRRRTVFIRDGHDEHHAIRALHHLIGYAAHQ